MLSDLLNNVIGFDWDEGNKSKNWEKHKVYFQEAEQVFFNNPLFHCDDKHSIIEQRYQCLGETNKGRMLFISFTIRNLRIRVISARDQSKKERGSYEK